MRRLGHAFVVVVHFVVVGGDGGGDYDFLILLVVAEAILQVFEIVFRFRFEFAVRVCVKLIFVLHQMCPPGSASVCTAV